MTTDVERERRIQVIINQLRELLSPEEGASEEVLEPYFAELRKLGVNIDDIAERLTGTG